MDYLPSASTSHVNSSRLSSVLSLFFPSTLLLAICFLFFYHLLPACVCPFGTSGLAFCPPHLLRPHILLGSGGLYVIDFSPHYPLLKTLTRSNRPTENTLDLASNRKFAQYQLLFRMYVLSSLSCYLVLIFHQVAKVFSHHLG
jgi:hypothetical protein